MGKCKPQKVMLIIALAMVMAACARPKPPREVQAPTMEESSSPTATIAVETPTAQPSTTEQPSLDEPTATVEPTEATAPAPTPTEVPPTPTAEPTPEPTATEAAPNFAYRVRSGDTLGTIAERFGTSAQAIAKLNNLPNTQIVRVGQELLIPGEEPKPVGAAGTIEYRVRAGEISQIALRHRTSTAAILLMNPSIGSPERLRAGALIIVPIGTEGPVLTHTVVAGETLASIAKDYGVGTEGPVLTHTVVAGETLASIAKDYGVSSQSIITLNALADASEIQTGDTLFIPQ